MPEEPSSPDVQTSDAPDLIPHFRAEPQQEPLPDLIPRSTPLVTDRPDFIPKTRPAQTPNGEQTPYTPEELRARMGLPPLQPVALTPQSQERHGMLRSGAAGAARGVVGGLVTGPQGTVEQIMVGASSFFGDAADFFSGEEVRFGSNKTSEEIIAGLKAGQDPIEAQKSDPSRPDKYGVTGPEITMLANMFDALEKGADAQAVRQREMRTTIQTAVYSGKGMTLEPRFETRSGATEYNIGTAAIAPSQEVREHDWVKDYPVLWQDPLKAGRILAGQGGEFAGQIAIQALIAKGMGGLGYSRNASLGTAAIYSAQIESVTLMDQAMNQGMSPEQATMLGIKQGAVVAGLDRIQLGILLPNLRPEARAAVVSGYLKRLLTDRGVTNNLTRRTARAASEAALESIQEAHGQSLLTDKEAEIFSSGVNAFVPTFFVSLLLPGMGRPFGNYGKEGRGGKNKTTPGLTPSGVVTPSQQAYDEYIERQMLSQTSPDRLMNQTRADIANGVREYQTGKQVAQAARQAAVVQFTPIQSTASRVSAPTATQVPTTNREPAQGEQIQSEAVRRLRNVSEAMAGIHGPAIQDARSKPELLATLELLNDHFKGNRDPSVQQADFSDLIMLLRGNGVRPADIRVEHAPMISFNGASGVIVTKTVTEPVTEFDPKEEALSIIGGLDNDPDTTADLQRFIEKSRNDSELLETLRYFQGQIPDADFSSVIDALEARQPKVVDVEVITEDSIPPAQYKKALDEQFRVQVDADAKAYAQRVADGAIPPIDGEPAERIKEREKLRQQIEDRHRGHLLQQGPQSVEPDRALTAEFGTYDSSTGVYFKGAVQDPELGAKGLLVVGGIGEIVETGKSIAITAFHGSGRATKEEIYNTGVGIFEPIAGAARYTALNEDSASVFGPVVKKLKVMLRNPFVIATDDDLRDAVRKFSGDDTIAAINEGRKAPSLESMRRGIEAAGHDGIVVTFPAEADYYWDGLPDRLRKGREDKGVKLLHRLFGFAQVIEFNSEVQSPATPDSPTVRANGKDIPVHFESNLDRALFEISRAVEAAVSVENIQAIQDATGLTKSEVAELAQTVKRETKAAAKDADEGETVSIQPVATKQPIMERNSPPSKAKPPTTTESEELTDWGSVRDTIRSHEHRSQDDAERRKGEQLTLDALFELERAANDAVFGKDGRARDDHRARPSVRSGSGSTLLGLGITRDLIQDGVVDLVGQPAATIRDIAAAAQVYRDPRFETFRIIYVKDNKIVAVEGTSARLADATSVFNSSKRTRALAKALVAKYGQDMTRWPAAAVVKLDKQSNSDVHRGVVRTNDRMRRLGADGYYFIHNHPSGNPNPSRDDVHHTKNLSRRIPGFRGHVIINSDRYAHMRSDGEYTIERLKKKSGADPLHQPDIPHPVLGERISSVDNLVGVAERINTSPGMVVIVYASSSQNSRVRAIESVPRNLLLNTKAMAEHIKGRMRAYGGPAVYLSLGSEVGRDAHQAAGDLMSEGHIRDFVFQRNDGESRSGMYDYRIYPRLGVDARQEPIIGNSVRELDFSYETQASLPVSISVRVAEPGRPVRLETIRGTSKDHALFLAVKKFADAKVEFVKVNRQESEGGNAVQQDLLGVEEQGGQIPLFGAETGAALNPVMAAAQMVRGIRSVVDRSRKRQSMPADALLEQVEGELGLTVIDRLDKVPDILPFEEWVRSPESVLNRAEIREAYPEARDDASRIIASEGVFRAMNKRSQASIEVVRRRTTQAEEEHVRKAAEIIMEGDPAKVRDLSARHPGVFAAAAGVIEMFRAKREAIRAMFTDKIRMSLNRNIDMKEAFERVLVGENFRAVLDEINDRRDHAGLRPLNNKHLAALFDRQDEIDNWGIEDYLTNIELGSILLQDKDGVTRAIAVSKEDALYKFMELVKEDPDIGTTITLRRGNPFDADAMQDFLPEQKIQAIIGEIESAVEDQFGQIAEDLNRREIRDAFGRHVRVEHSAPRTAGVGPLKKRHGILRGEKNIFDVLPAYMYMIDKKLAFEPAVLLMQQNIDTQKYPKNVRQLLVNQANDAMKRTHWIEDEVLDTIFRDWLKLTDSSRIASRMSGHVTHLQAVLKLGGRLGSAMVNFAAGHLNTFAAIGPTYMARGYNWMLNSPEGRAFIKRERELGTLALDTVADSLHTTGASALSKGVDALSNTLMFPFTFAEKVNREMALASNYLYSLEVEGMTPEAAALDARYALRAQQFVYLLSSIPRVLRSPTGRVAGQFKTYMVKTAEMLSTFNGTQWSRYLGGLMMMGGPAAYLTILRSIPWLATLFQEPFDKIEEEANAYFRGTQLEGFQAGLPGMLMHADMSAQVAPQLPRTAWEWGGPMVADMKRMWDTHMLPLGEQPTPQDQTEFVTGLSPALFYWNMALDAQVTNDGWVLNRNGQRVYHVDDSWKKSLLAAGIPPIDLKQQQRTTQRIIRSEERRRVEFRDAQSILVNQVMRGEKFEESVFQEYVRFGGDMTTLMRAVIDANLDPRTRMILDGRIVDRGERAEAFEEAAIED